MAIRLNAPIGRNAAGQGAEKASDHATSAACMAMVATAGSDRPVARSAAAHARPAGPICGESRPINVAAMANSPSPRTRICESITASSTVSATTMSSQPSIIPASRALLTPRGSRRVWIARNNGSAGAAAASSAMRASRHQASRIWPTRGSRVVLTICPSLSSRSNSVRSASRDGAGADIRTRPTGDWRSSVISKPRCAGCEGDARAALVNAADGKLCHGYELVRCRD